MGRKAVFSLLYFLSILLTLLLLAAAVLSWRASFISPEQGGFWSTLALLMPVALFANAVALVWWLSHRRWWLTLFPIAALALNFDYVSATVQLPDFAADPGAHDICIATLNSHGFAWGDSRYTTLAEISSMMIREQVDVLCMQEFVPTPGVPADAVAESFSSRMPYFVCEKSAAIVSRYPILDHKYVQFPKTNNDYMRVDLLVGRDTIRVISVHLQTSGISSLQRQYQRASAGDIPVDMVLDVFEHNSRIRTQQVRDIRALIDSSPYPVILAGDFNDTPSSYTYRTMRGDMTDGFQAAGNGYGATFRGIGGLLRIDYIFYDDSFTGIRYWMPREAVSDHKVVIAGLRFGR